MIPLLLLTVILTCSTEEIHRKVRQIDSPSPFFAPAGTNEAGEPRAPITIELTHNLTIMNGIAGRCGICWRTYRVLHDLKYKPVEECRRYENSRQASFGDLTEFYHTLYDSRRQNRTINFLLADQFPGFALLASLMYSAMSASPPVLLIEAANSASHALCVQSFSCPVNKITTMTTTEAPATSTNRLVSKENSYQLPGGELDTEIAVPLRTMKGDIKRSNFWDAILANSDSKAWVIATLLLACTSFLLMIAMIVTIIWICHYRRRVLRKRCRGTCRFGCRCSPETIRQVATDAAVCGPLGANQATLSNISNGSILGGMVGMYPTVGRSWGMSSNGKAPLTPLYVSLSANDKLLNSQACNTPPPQGLFLPCSTVDPLTGQLHNWSQLHMPMRKSKRLSPEAIWRSNSEGSSISGQTVPSAAGSGPSALRSQHSRASGRTVLLTNITSPSSANANTCMNSHGFDDASAMPTNATTLLLPNCPTRQDGYKRDESAMNSSMLRERTRIQAGHNTPQACRCDSTAISSSNGDFPVIDCQLYDQRGVNIVNDQLQDSANITPPAAFYDYHGGCLNRLKQSTNSQNVNLKDDQNIHLSDQSESSWLYANTGDVESSTDVSQGRANFPPISNNFPAGGVKVLPTGNNFGLKSLASADLKRKNGYMPIGIIEGTSLKKSGILASRILSNPLKEEIEHSYGIDANNAVQMRLWAETAP